MDDPIEITNSESRIEREKPEYEWEVYDPSHPAWPSRSKCFKAYICLMSYQSTLTLCQRLGKYKMTIFFPYLIWNIFIGAPAVLVEVMIGRFIKGNVSEAWNMCPLAKGVCICVFFISAGSIVCTYIFSLYLVEYFFASLRGYLVWEKCRRHFNTINCYEIGKKSEAIQKCLESHSAEFCGNLTWETAGEQLWKKVTEESNAVEIVLTLTTLAAIVLFVLLFIYKGIHSLEKMLGIFVYPSIVFWLLLAIASFSASSMEAFVAVFDISWTYFVAPEMWLEGLEDTFYILGLCRFGIPFVSCHGKFTDNILHDVLLVIFCTLTCCFLASAPILSVIVIAKERNGHNMSEPLFTDITDVFISMSEALALLPYPKSMWCVIHYVDCFLISISSQAVLLLGVCEALHGIFKKKEKYYFYIVLAVSGLSFIASALFLFYEDILELNQVTCAMTLIVLSTITWQVFYGIRKFNLDYFYLMGRSLPLFIKFTWITLLVVPIVGLIMRVCLGASNAFYVQMLCIIVIFGTFIIIMTFRYRHLQKPISLIFQPNPDWGPDNALLKKSRMVFDKSTVTREFMYRQELYKKPQKKMPDFGRQCIVQQT